MKRTLAALCGLLLAGCATPGAPAPGATVRQVAREIHAAADRLRASSYRVVFDVRLSAGPVRWTGTMRTLGGVDAMWSADGTATDGATVLDTVSIVDAGGVRYLDPRDQTFRGYEWAALPGVDRTSYYWRDGAPAPVPDVDPFIWCDLSTARAAMTARTADGGLRLRLTGVTPGPRLTGALARAALPPPGSSPLRPPPIALDLTLTPAGLPARLDARLPGATLTLIVTGTGARERIKIPGAGQYAAMTEPF